ncbi:MAG TPA: M14 family zinc carboxypeptidase [Pseudomonadota bacterium]|nr:M14 family zinc carboxypeptidase [Pseudomonadota bacterium]
MQKRFFSSRACKTTLLGWVLGPIFSLCGVTAAAETSPVGPVPLTPPALPTEPLRYSDEWVKKELTELHLRYPKLTKLVPIGKSHEGRPLWALAIGRNLKRHDGRPAILVNAAHHGVETFSIDLALDVADVLLLRAGDDQRQGLRIDPGLDKKVQRWLKELVIWCVPVVNPDGVWASLHGFVRTGRKNGRDNNGNGKPDRGDGVDLNRNYPFRWGFLGDKGSSPQPDSAYFRGPAAGSEPETQAIMRLAESEHFAASLSFHTGNVTVLAPYTIDNVQSPTPNEAWTVAEELVAGLPRHPQGKDIIVRRNIYPVDGTDQDYLRGQFGTLALLVEGARRDPTQAEARRNVVLAMRPIWTRLLDRYLDGPSVYGVVRDGKGRPVVAEVSIVEQTMAEQEHWQTRCRDGHYDRFLPGPGEYTVRVTAPGVAPKDQRIKVGKERLRIDFTVEAAASSGQCPKEPPG